jgi:hypothetical protein
VPRFPLRTIRVTVMGDRPNERPIASAVNPAAWHDHLGSGVIGVPAGAFQPLDIAGTCGVKILGG